MKDICIKLMMVFGVVILCISCSKDQLEKTPLDAISENNVFNDISLLNAFVGGNYNAVRSIYRADRMGTEALADLVFFERGDLSYLEGSVDATNGEGTTLGLWGGSYSFLKDINTFFIKIENSQLSQSELDPFIGEMKFVRAWIYFELSRYYGGVPIITKRFELDDETFDVSRNTYEEVVAFIIKELDEAIPLLPDGGPKARATKAAAMALKARTLLYAASELFSPGGDAAKWQAAANANKAVMDLPGYALNGTYRDIFLEPLKDEVIFTKEFVTDNNQGAWSGANVLLWPNGYQGWSNVTPVNKFIDMFEMSNGELPYLADGTTVNPASGFDPQNPYVNRDPRFYDIVLYNGAPLKDRECQYWLDKDDPANSDLAGLDSPSSSINPWDASKTGYNILKLTDVNNDVFSGSNFAPGSNTPYVIFRTTEFYLNYAEAQIALGNEAEARDAINAVRARGSVNMPPITATGQALVEAYRKERAIELFLEDHRFHDIRRWKIAENVIDPILYGVNVIRDSNTGTFEYSYDRVARDSKAWNNKQYLLPIPDDEIKKSNNTLTQNPGY